MHIFQVNTPGQYSFTITRDAFTVNGTIDVIQSTVSTNTPNDNFQIQVFPNPVEDFLQYNIVGNQAINASLTLLDINGRSLKTIDQSIDVISVKGLVAGNYILRYVDRYRSVNVKLVKK